MFLKNNMRPAFADAANGGQASDRKLKNDAFTFDAGASETDDFGSFSSGASNSANRAGGRKPTGGKFKPSAIIIAVAAVVAVVLLLVLIIAIASGRSGDIKYENNTFVAFSDEDGIYHVAANGKVIGNYENEIELIPADDRSFAYVIESSDDGYRVTITDGNDVTEITPSPVTKILATAGLKPGVVWLDADNGIYLYTEKGGEERITRDVDATSANADESFFFISADASTVVYTKIDEDRPADLHHLCVYTDHFETKFQKNMYPVAVSDDGSMIYAYAYSKNSIATKTLYVLPFNDEYDRYLLSDNFLSIVDINTDGNEVVFTTLGDTDSAISTYVVSFDIKKMNEVAQPVRIAKGAIYTPVSIDNNVARFATFEDTYFEAQISVLDIIDNQAPVYYVGKDYDVRRISKFAGKFDPDGDYFYYTNNDGTLQRVDLSDEDAVSQKIAEDVVDFEITQKGNVYWLDDTTRLMYYSNSKEKKTRIADNVEGISMHTYSNTLYFTLTDAVNIYTTEEGSEKEAAKFDAGTVTGLPVFATPEYKRTFAAFYDMDNEEWRLFYTSNGKRFKLIGVCAEINGFDVPLTIGDIIDDIISDIGDDSETESDTES